MSRFSVNIISALLLIYHKAFIQCSSDHHRCFIRLSQPTSRHHSSEHIRRCIADYCSTIVNEWFAKWVTSISFSFTVNQICLIVINFSSLNNTFVTSRANRSNVNSSFIKPVFVNHRFRALAVRRSAPMIMASNDCFCDKYWGHNDLFGWLSLCFDYSWWEDYVLFLEIYTRTNVNIKCLTYRLWNWLFSRATNNILLKRPIRALWENKLCNWDIHTFGRLLSYTVINIVSVVQQQLSNAQWPIQNGTLSRWTTPHHISIFNAETSCAQSTRLISLAAFDRRIRSSTATNASRNREFWRNDK